MANPTTNFGWVMPTTTSLVTNLPADFNTFGQGVDTSMAGLLGGTTGQVLSKTSGTNMAFTWINNDQGDLTAITAGTGISVTSGTGPIPSVAIDTAVTVDKTTAQTLTNKTLTTPIISSISNTGTLTLPTSTDTLVGRATTDTLTNKTISATSNTLTGVINNTLTSTTGDIIYASAANTPARLGIGSTSQVLTVTGGVPVWATPAGGGGMTLLSTTTSWNSTSTTISIASGYTNILIIGTNIAQNSDPNDSVDCNFNADASGIYGNTYIEADSSTGPAFQGAFAYQTYFRLMDITGTSTNKGSFALIINKYTDSIAKNFTFFSQGSNSTKRKVKNGMGFFNSTSAVSSFKIFHGAAFDSGTTVYVYGVN